MFAPLSLQLRPITHKEIDMVMREDEANKMLCPMCMANPDGDWGCAGSKCFAWRENGEHYRKNEEMIPIGYCGLAGKP
jgi:hypothetical protein